MLEVKRENHGIYNAQVLLRKNWTDGEIIMLPQYQQ